MRGQFGLARNRRAAPRILAQASTFVDPRSVSGCIFWVRADLGITLNGSNVSAWADQTASGMNLVQATASSQPAYNASGGGNNQAYIAFPNQTKQRLAAASGTGIQSLWVVMRSIWPGAAVVVIAYEAGVTVGDVSALATSTTGTVQLNNGASGEATVFFNQNTDVTILAYDANSDQNNTFLAVNNGTHQAGTGDGSGGLDLGPPGCGSNDIVSAHSQDCWIYEMAGYNRKVNATDSANLQTYAHTRYGL